MTNIYWLVAIAGFFDLDFLDFDLDLDGDVTGPLSALALFIQIGKVPIALVFSLIVLNFWILSMLMYFLPITAGGTINGILLVPALVLSVLITKIEVKPLKKVCFKEERIADIEHKVLTQRCRLLTELVPGKLGQASIKQRGASIVINVKTLFEEESFDKGELAFVFEKDAIEDIYYVTKTLVADEEI